MHSSACVINAIDDIGLCDNGNSLTAMIYVTKHHDYHDNGIYL